MKKLVDRINNLNRSLLIEKLDPPKDTLVRWRIFVASDSDMEAFGADIVNFLGSKGYDSIKIKKILLQVTNIIKKGGLAHLESVLN